MSGVSNGITRPAPQGQPKTLLRLIDAFNFKSPPHPCTRWAAGHTNCSYFAAYAPARGQLRQIPKSRESQGASVPPHTLGNPGGLLGMGQTPPN